MDYHPGRTSAPIWSSSIGVDAGVRPLDPSGNSGVPGRALLTARCRSLTAPDEVRGAARKEVSASTADAAFCIRPAMQAFADEWWWLVLLVQSGH
jgi:hypothetical protein